MSIRKLPFTKKQYIAILAGFAVTVVIGIIVSTLSFVLYAYLARIVNPAEYFSSSDNQPYSSLRILIKIVSFFVPVFGGVVTGRIAKENGWQCGVILGLVLLFLSISLASLAFIPPSTSLYGSNYSPDLGRQLAIKNIMSQLLHAPLTIGLTAIGGYLGEVTFKRSKKK